MPTSRESLITVLYGSTATGAPGDLYDGEFAFANASGTGKKLFIGSGGNNTANWVGAVIEDAAAINWSSVTSENNKLPTQYAVKSLANGYLPLAGGSMTGDITLGTSSEIIFNATGGGGGVVKLQAPAATTSNATYTFTLPVNDGSAAEVLTTDGNGVLSWASAGTATNVSVTNDDTSTTTYIAFTTATSGATPILVDSDGLTYNASTDTLTLAGDISVNGGDVTTTNTTASVFPNTATAITIGGAATSLGLGATTGSGTTSINNTLRVGLSQGTISTPAGSATNHLNITASGNFRVIPTSNVVNGGSRPNLIVENADGAAGVVEISGGDLYLGRKTADDSTYTAVGIVFEGASADTAETLLTVVDPTADRTITLPDATGTVALLGTGSTTDGRIPYYDTTSNTLLGSSILSFNDSTSTFTLDGTVNIGATLGTSNSTVNLINTVATTLNVGGAATSVSIGAATGTTTINNANTVVTGDLAVNGADITTTATGTATLFNTNATTLNLGGVATAITMGATSGTTTTIRGGTLVGNTTTQNLFDTTATTLNIGRAATSLVLGATTGTCAIQNPSITFGPSAAVTLQTLGTSTSHMTLAPAGELRITPSDDTVTGGTRPQLIVQTPDDGVSQVQITGGDLYLGRRSANGSTYFGSRLIFEGSTNDTNETILQAADATGGDQTITLPNATGTLALVAGSDTQVMFNDGGSALGGDSGLTYNKTTDSLTITGDLAVNGGNITTTSTGTAAIFDSNTSAINLGRGCTGITIGASSGTTTTIRGGTLVGNTTTQNLFNTTATTVNFAGAATTLSIGAATGTTTINNANTVVTGDLAVDGGDITTGAATATLFNSTATTITMGAAATTFTAAGAAGAQTVTIGGASTAASTYNFGTGATANLITKVVNIGTGGAAGSTTNVNLGSSNGGTVAIGYNAIIGNDLTVTGNLTVSGDTVTQNVSTLTVEDPLIKLASGNTSTDSLDIGFYGTYDTSGSQDLFCGLFRDQTDGKFRLFVDSQSEPTTVVNTAATGYTVATLVANIRGGTFT